MSATPEQAAATLAARFEGEPWFRGVTEGTAGDGPALVLQVATGADRYREGLPREWERLPVLVRAVGRLE